MSTYFFSTRLAQVWNNLCARDFYLRVGYRTTQTLLAIPMVLLTFLIVLVLMTISDVIIRTWLWKSVLLAVATSFSSPSITLAGILAVMLSINLLYFSLYGGMWLGLKVFLKLFSYFDQKLKPLFLK